MAKTRIKLIICVIALCLATMFLWLGKTPFTTPEPDEPSLSLHSSQQEVQEALQESVVQEPVVQEPVENPINSSADNETDAPENAVSAESSQAPAESPQAPAETVNAWPERLTDAFPEPHDPLELPVEGATGWAAITMPLYSEANIESRVVTDFRDGQVFVIIEEQGDFWYVESSRGESGWVEHIGCLINLPDVIPSIVYNITNAYSALTRTSGQKIPGVTGQRLYKAWAYNPRLLRYEFVVPSLYSTSKLLFEAQQFALESGDTIIMHEAYRAHASQQRSVNLIRELMESNDDVRSAIEDGPWSLNWFISTTMSNHQRGAAFDVSLGKVLSYEIHHNGSISFPKITEYFEYLMPTTIHELSPLAVALAEPVSSRSRDAWRSVPLSDTMTTGAIRLQRYFDGAGLTPLASEWWHFNDLEGAVIATELGIVGSFFIDDVLSVSP